MKCIPWDWLQGCCSPAIHVAASNGQTECLDFLVKRLGIKYLSYGDEYGFGMIHLAAANSWNPDTLRKIIVIYPHYKPKFSSFPLSEENLPWNEAACKGMKENADLLEHFPELIMFKDSLGQYCYSFSGEVSRYFCAGNVVTIGST